MSIEHGSAVAGAFWSDSPVIVITSESRGRINGQIAVTAVTASIVHSIPRLLLGIWKGNYTHEFISDSRICTIHLLRESQIDLVRNFGFYTGREKNKFRDIEYFTGLTGSPVIHDVHSYAEARIINRMDCGDMSAFLANIVDGSIKSSERWMTLNYFYRNAPPEWIREYELKLSRSIDFSLPIINKIDYIPFEP